MVWNGVGRLPLVGYKDVGNINDFIKRWYLMGDYTDYTIISEILENGYQKKLIKMTP